MAAQYTPAVYAPNVPVTKRTYARKYYAKKGGKSGNKKVLSRGLRAASVIPGPVGIGAGIAAELADAIGLKRKVTKGLGKGKKQDATFGGAGQSAYEIVSGQNQGGPGIVAGSNAPVAYGRQALDFTTKMTQISDEVCRVRSLEPVGMGVFDNAITPFSGGWIPCNPVLGYGGYYDTCTPVAPFSSAINPWMGQIGQDFEYYKLRKLKFHYVHSVPTTQTGLITVFYTGDVMYNTITTTTGSGVTLGDLYHLGQAQVQSSSQWATCAVYEDMCLDVKIEAPWGDWKYNMLPQTASTYTDPMVDPRMNYAGAWYVYAQNLTVPAGPSTILQTGDWYIEMEVDFKFRKLPTVQFGFFSELKMISDMTPKRGHAELRKILDKIENNFLKHWLDMEKTKEFNAERRAQREAKEKQELVEAESIRGLFDELVSVPSASASSTQSNQKPTFPRLTVTSGGRSA